MRSRTACFDELRAFCENTPLIDCHDHSGDCGPKHADPIAAIITGYFPSDVQSASSDADIGFILDFNRPIEERWPVLEKAWKRTRHTGYAQVARLVLKKFYDEDDLTLDGLHRIKDKLLDIEDEKTFDGILDEAKIAARIEVSGVAPIDWARMCRHDALFRMERTACSHAGFLSQAVASGFFISGISTQS